MNDWYHHSFSLGYWLGKKEEPKQKEYNEITEYNSREYSYVKEGESVKDLT